MMGCGNSKSRRLKNNNKHYKVKNEQETTTTDLVAQMDDDADGPDKTNGQQNNADHKNSTAVIQTDKHDSESRTEGFKAKHQKK